MTQVPPRLLLMTPRPRSGVYPSGVDALRGARREEKRWGEGGGGVVARIRTNLYLWARVYDSVYCYCH